ncbi:MAG TPA: hypothetical protein ENI94_04025 [Gammaproteobacteria bacterium]|nr:hypothetical protein [Gammaproteobacteria bacterium]
MNNKINNKPQLIQYPVEQLLLEQGEYLPLEFLLQEGRLTYADYEAWRNGELDTLDEALFGDRQHIKQQLMQAADYLQQRGWQAETITYHAWRNGLSHSVRFSRNDALNDCFHQRYRKPQDQPQLDMFTDAPATHRVNGITRALVNRDIGEARRQLEGLYDTAPDHIRLGELERLVEAAESLDAPVTDAAADLRILQETLTPLAQSLLGKESRNLLVPLWRRLSAALHDQPYHATQPEQHTSYTASQAMDWDSARQAVEQVPHWQNDPVLLQRHARACEPLHRRCDALLSWFSLCWRFAEQSDAIKSTTDTELRQQWEAFQELEPELPAHTFPAWLLLDKPGLSNVLAGPRHDAANCPASYRTLHQLQSKLSAQTDIALRAQLKQQDAVLFQHYLLLQ